MKKKKVLLALLALACVAMVSCKSHPEPPHKHKKPHTEKPHHHKPRPPKP
ncbi:MAG: hypothetical protein ACLVKO_09055 [Dysgonomonas sp.]